MDQALLVILLDRSGSMDNDFSAGHGNGRGRVRVVDSEKKLDGAKEELLKIFTGLPPSQRLALVPFNHLPSKPYIGVAGDLEGIRMFLGSVDAQGATDIGGALASVGSIPSIGSYRFAKVTVVSDGLDNPEGAVQGAAFLENVLQDSRTVLLIDVLLIDPSPAGLAVAEAIRRGGGGIESVVSSARSRSEFRSRASEMLHPERHRPTDSSPSASIEQFEPSAAMPARAARESEFGPQEVGLPEASRPRHATAVKPEYFWPLLLLLFAISLLFLDIHCLTGGTEDAGTPSVNIATRTSDMSVVLDAVMSGRNAVPDAETPDMSADAGPPDADPVAGAAELGDSNVQELHDD